MALRAFYAYPHGRRWIAAAVLVGFGATACDDGPSSAGPNVAPEVVISAPAVGVTFAGGMVIDVAIAATDAEEGVLAPEALSWWVILHHAAHVHPYLPPTTGAVGQIVIGRAGHEDHDVFLRLYARAVDAGGLADTTFVDIHPQLTTLTLASEPSGLQLTLDGQPRTTPYTENAIVGMERVIGAVDPQESGSAAFSFASWSDGGEVVRTVVVPTTALTLTATFDSIGAANAAPTVEITAPVAGAIVTAGTAVMITAAAADGDGSVVRVEFFVDGLPVDTLAAEPFSASWVPSGTGPRALTARATDDDGAARLSEVVEVTVQAAGTGDVLAPSITLVTPADGALDLTGAVNLTATATDDVGVTVVEFSVDGEFLAFDTSAPFEATVPNTAAYASGAHVVRARAGDAAGNWSPWAAATVTFGGTVALPEGFTRTTFVSGMGSTPTAMAFAPDGRLFVTEQFGALRVVKAGVLLAEPFLTLPVDGSGERGLLGIAFDPDFEITGWVYVYHTSTVGGAHNRISRFTADGDVAVAGSEVVLVALPELPDGGRHNGGAMRFGVDGKLYVAVGDAAIASNAPLLTTPFGKMLRFNRNGTIPPDNPFYGETSGVNRAIWARGLRNPFTFDIHPATGRMHINDVGQNTWEEINVGRPGADFGWPATEGPTDISAYDAPLLAYKHSGSPTLFDGLAVVGGTFYAPAVDLFGPEYRDDYFFADYVHGWIYRLDAQAGWTPYAFALLGDPITGLGVGPDGALYVLVGTRVDRIGR
ncbi:MAG: PQQ-dependent sugar dehydrogenase [Gemmatimonadaceae bacterium]